MLEENRRIWVLGGAVIAIAVVLLGGYLVLRGGAPESEVTLVSIPNDLTLTLDGRPVAANGKIKVKAGQHTLSAAREGFENYTETIKAADGKPLQVKMYLYSNGPAGRTWEKNHPDQALEAEAEAGRRFDEIGRRVSQKYPILQELPHVGAGFGIKAGTSKLAPDNPEQVGFYVTIFGPDGRANVLKWLIGHGYDPSTLELIYTNG